MIKGASTSSDGKSSHFRIEPRPGVVVLFSIPGPGPVITRNQLLDILHSMKNILIVVQTTSDTDMNVEDPEFFRKKKPGKDGKWRYRHKLMIEPDYLISLL